MLSTCATCNGRLDTAAIIVGADTCTTCETKRIRLAVDPWSFFVRVLRSKVRADGTVHASDVRPAVRGRIEPKVIATCWRRARSRQLGLLVEIGTERSDDAAGKNAGRHEPVYRATDRLRERVST